MDATLATIAPNACHSHGAPMQSSLPVASTVPQALLDGIRRYLPAGFYELPEAERREAIRQALKDLFAPA